MMNTEKILALLGTTSQQKMNIIHKMETNIPVSATESVNDILNAELFGKPKVCKPTIRSAREQVTKLPAKEEGTSAVAASVNALSIPSPVLKRKKPFRAKESVDIDINSEDILSNNIVSEDGTVIAVFDYCSTAMPEDLLNSISIAITDAGLTLEENNEDEDEEFTADEAVAIEEVHRLTKMTRRPSEKATRAIEEVHRLTKMTRRPSEKATRAIETLIKTSNSNFPEKFDFDDKAFAENYGIDKSTITAIFVKEEKDEPAHIEISFIYDGATVCLTITSEGFVSETVDAEIIDPVQFTAEFIDKEDEEGNISHILAVELIDEEEEDDEDESGIKSEEDSLTMSEGDSSHFDESGATSTPEFIEEAGLNLDEHYSTSHRMPVAKNPANRINMAKESLARRIARR